MVERKSTGWVGWIFFASALMMLAGGLNILAGLTGIFNGNFYASTGGELIVFNYASWGWIHLLLGVAVLAAGTALLAGKTWARIVAAVLAVVSIVAHVAFTSIPMVVCNYYSHRCIDPLRGHDAR